MLELDDLVAKAPLVGLCSIGAKPNKRGVALKDANYSAEEQGVIRILLTIAAARGGRFPAGLAHGRLPQLFL
jgi:hypothetical protein